MKTTNTKTVLPVLLALSVVLVGCNNKEKMAAVQADKSLISPKKMLPPAEILGDDCSINKGMSDRRARAIIDGTFTPSKGGGDMNPILCVYRKPNAMVTVTWCEEVTTAAAKLQKGIEATKRSVEVQDLGDFGVEGFKIIHKGNPGCRFRYGNLIVDISGHSVDEQDKIIKSFIDYYASVAK